MSRHASTRALKRAKSAICGVRSIATTSDAPARSIMSGIDPLFDPRSSTRLPCHDRAHDRAVEEIPTTGAAVGGRDLSNRQPAAKIDRRVVAVARRDVGLETTQRAPRICLGQQRSSEASVEGATIGIALRKEPGAARRVATDAGHRGKPRAASRNAHDAIERVPHAADAGRVRARHHVFGVFGGSRARAHLTQADEQPRFPQLAAVRPSSPAHFPARSNTRRPRGEALGPHPNRYSACGQATPVEEITEVFQPAALRNHTRTAQVLSKGLEFSHTHGCSEEQAACPARVLAGFSGSRVRLGLCSLVFVRVLRGLPCSNPQTLRRRWHCRRWGRRGSEQRHHGSHVSAQVTAVGAGQAKRAAREQAVVGCSRFPRRSC